MKILSPIQRGPGSRVVQAGLVGQNAPQGLQDEYIPSQAPQGDPPKGRPVPERPDRAELRAPRCAQEAWQPRGGYAPAGRYLWDSWVVQREQGDYLLFHLDAPANVDPDERHDLAQVRQARSTDMEHWTDLGITFGPGPAGAWDDKVVWSGNSYRENGKYFLFYTARHKESDLNLGQIQRIAVATSEDGVHWHTATSLVAVLLGLLLAQLRQRNLMAVESSRN